jgi:hypothetical protein
VVAGAHHVGADGQAATIGGDGQALHGRFLIEFGEASAIDEAPEVMPFEGAKVGLARGGDQL